jgi:hypothetical protein
MKFILAFLAIFLAVVGTESIAADLSIYKKVCSEIGFKTGTEKHGGCVLKLLSRAEQKQQLVRQKISKDQEKIQTRTNQRRIEQRQREILASQRRIEELNRQRVVAAQRAAQKAAKEAKRQRRLDGLTQFFQGMAIMNGSQPSRSNNSRGSGSSGPGYLNRQYVSGHNRICVYSQMGSQRVRTIGAGDICPITLR